MSDLSPRVPRRTFLKGLGLGLGSVAVAGPARAAALFQEGQKLQLARVWAPTLASQRLLGGFDDTHNVFDDGSIELLLWPGDLAKLRGTGLRHEITVEDLVAHDRALQANAAPRPLSLEPQPGERTDYRRLVDFETDMSTLVQQHPDKAKLLTLPNATLEGRPVHGLEIAANVSRRDGRPVFYMDGMHHAREWPAAEMPIMWAYDLLESYGTDTRITALMDTARFVVVPLQNPDGFHHSRESLVQNSNTGTVPPGGIEGYWRKNRRSVTGVTIPMIQKNPDAYGIDPNRNYAHNWGGPGASSSNFDQTSRGSAAFSEPESRNVAHVLSTYQVTALESSHTAGNLVLRPWGYTYDDPPDDELLRTLGDECGVITGYKSQKSIQLYITTGTTVDYGYGSFASLAFSFEHSGTGFHPAYASAVPQMYAKCRPAFLLLAEAAANPAYHGVITGRAVDGSGAPIPSAEIRLHKEFATPLWPNAGPDYPEVIDTSMVTNEDGIFEYHTNPSTRPHIAFEGGSEAFTLQASAGYSAESLDVVVARGETVDLGDITIP
ncbi:MAG: M14 family zinc carboxypeptidase [Actinomycetota bacterium]